MLQILSIPVINDPQNGSCLGLRLPGLGVLEAGKPRTPTRLWDRAWPRCHALLFLPYVGETAGGFALCSLTSVGK